MSKRSCCSTPNCDTSSIVTLYEGLLSNVITYDISTEVITIMSSACREFYRASSSLASRMDRHLRAPDLHGRLVRAEDLANDDERAAVPHLSTRWRQSSRHATRHSPFLLRGTVWHAIVHSANGR